MVAMVINSLAIATAIFVRLPGASGANTKGYPSQPMRVPVVTAAGA